MNYINENKKILLVDDNESSIKLITKLSEKLNIKIDYVFNGKECIDLLKKGCKYDLMFLDDDMEVLNAKETISKLKQIKNINTKFILLTNDLNKEFTNEYKELGFDDLLIKPATKEKLKEIYNNYLLKKD